MAKQFYIKQFNVNSMSKIVTGTSLSDCLVSYQEHSLEGFFTPLQRCSRCILQPQPTGQAPEVLRIPKREACRGRQTCAKSSEKNSDHMEEDLLKEIRFANCRKDHPAYARSRNVYKKEKEIRELKHERNVSFLEARKIV